MDQSETTNIEQQLQAKVAQLQQHLAIVQAAMRVLSARVFCFLSLLGGLGVFAWSVADPNIQRTAAGACYALLVFLPTLYWARDSIKGG